MIKKATLSLVLSILLVLPVVLFSTSCTNKSDDENIAMHDFSKDEEINRKNEELARKFGLENIEKLEINYINPEHSVSGNGNKVSAQNVYFYKHCEMEFKPVINDILSSMLNSKNTEEKDFKEKYVYNYEKEVEQINNNKIKAANDTPTKLSGYAVYPDMEPIAPKKFNPNLTLKDNKGKSVEIPYYFESMNNVALIDGKYIEMNYVNTSLIDSILSERELHFEVPEDIYQLVGDKNIPFFRNAYDLKLPNSLKEQIYGDRFNLYWAYINDLMEGDKFFDGKIKENLGKKVRFEKYTMPNVKLKGYKKQDGSLYLESKGASANSNVILVTVRDDKQKLIAAYLTSKDGDSFKCRYDGKSMVEINDKNFDKWVVGAFKKDKYFEEISKMKPEDLIKKFYYYLDKNDNKADKLYVPVIADYDGKVSWNRPVMIESVNNIAHAKVKKVSPSDSIIPDIRYPNKVDYYANVDIKYKEVISSEGGEEILSFDLNKYSDGFGYRIIQYGY